MTEKKLSEELRFCIEQDGCSKCSCFEKQSKLTCPGLLQKAYEVVKRYEEMFPCWVGDTVYELQEIRHRIQPLEIISVNIGRMGEPYFNWELKDGIGIYQNVRGFGASQLSKTVFLTKEAAEKALKEMEDRKNGEVGFCR
ncbi:MAG: hypothetical protein HFH72_09225 [Lachnospiraceae bacterium]|nr:hypothetical protein [Lachnospiraceae bacterium]